MELILPTALDAWKAALHQIRAQGRLFRDADAREGWELLNLTVTIEHPQVGVDEPIDLLRTFDRWVYPSKDELLNIVFQERELLLYDYTYGNRIFHYQNVKDQINTYVLPLLREHPLSRRAMVITIDPLADLVHGNRNAPGLISVHFRLVDDLLLMTAVVRSNDFFIGWPANIFQLASLQHYVAEKLGVRVGSLSTHSLSAHVFSEYVNEVEEVLRR